MTEKNVAFSFTSYQPVSEDRKKRYSIIKAPNQLTYNDYLKNTIIGCLTVMIDRSKVGTFFFPEIRSSQDMALWLLIFKGGFKAYGLNQNLAEYRVVSNSNTANKLFASIGVWNVYRNIEKINFFLSLWYFSNYVFNAVKKRWL